MTWGDEATGPDVASPVPARLGWPRLLRRWVPVGLVIGLVLVGAVHVAGYGDGAVLFWQLLQIFAVILPCLALALWGMACIVHAWAEHAVARERRRPISSAYFDVPRCSGIAAAVVGTSAAVVTIAFAIRTGDVWSFADC